MGMLFPEVGDLPEGFVYREDVLSSDEEARLVEGLRTLAFGEVRMRGQVARRRAKSAIRSRSGRSGRVAAARDLGTRAPRDVRTLTCEGPPRAPRRHRGDRSKTQTFGRARPPRARSPAGGAGGTAGGRRSDADFEGRGSHRAAARGA